jgi:hypothetical protein
MTSKDAFSVSTVEYIKSFQIDPAWEDFGKVSEEPESFAINPAWEDFGKYEEDFGKYEEPERFAIDPSWEDFGKLDSKKFKEKVLEFYLEEVTSPARRKIELSDDEFELPRNPIRPRNPVSPYSIYSSEMSSVVKKENPNMSTIQIISHIGEKWRKERNENSEIYIHYLTKASLI